MRFLALLFLYVTCSEAFKYLVYNPKFGASHAMLVGKIADELAYAGHEVVVLQLNISPELKPGHTHKSIRLITRDLDYKFENPTKNFWVEEFTGFFNTLDMMKLIGSKFRGTCEYQLKDEGLMEELRNEKFDVGLSETFDVCGYGIFEKIGLNKTVAIIGSSMFLPESSGLGIPTPTSFVPDLFGRGIDGFSGRLKNFFTYFMGKQFIMPAFTGEIGKAFSLVPGRPDYRELIARSSFFLVNADEFVDYPRPISHKYINVAGYGMRRAMAKTGELDGEFKKVFEKAQKGVIYVSFGSMMQSSLMPDAFKQAFIEAFASFPEVQFIWKYENASHNVAAGIENIVTGTWLPQREILAHPKTLAFLTHAGMNSVTEATYSGVPMVCLPVFAEQPRNADMVVRKGIAVQLEKSKLTKEAIQKALKEIIENKSYKEKSQKLSKIIRDKPQSPEERIVKACEFAAKYELHEHLDLPGRTLGVIEFYNIDVIALLIVLPIIAVFMILIALRLLAHKLSQKLSKSKEE
ncbi:unnamed protein product [Bursaphelenchus xylophilus]|uniref:glucuronosyltransferase n=1 Tax=Bursaphelenchus xylophilus TaxID=6326 RepID=A0A1I7SUK9_BURXY|nr:unnamed protein product [Bursaphelenchus xylophilus]CAG9118615.1 unnamed protein product [Bursaphelenchus xylophilus]